MSRRCVIRYCPYLSYVNAAQLATSIQGISSGVASEVASANSALTKGIASVNKIDPFHPITVPSISVADLNSLQNVTIPSSFQQSLTSLNSSTPTAANIKSIIEDM